MNKIKKKKIKKTQNKKKERKPPDQSGLHHLPRMQSKNKDDLGNAPDSHIVENMVLRLSQPDYLDANSRIWQTLHEASCSTWDADQHSDGYSALSRWLSRENHTVWIIGLRRFTIRTKISKIFSDILLKQKWVYCLQRIIYFSNFGV